MLNCFVKHNFGILAWSWSMSCHVQLCETLLLLLFFLAHFPGTSALFYSLYRVCRIQAFRRACTLTCSPAYRRPAESCSRWSARRPRSTCAAATRRRRRRTRGSRATRRASRALPSRRARRTGSWRRSRVESAGWPAGPRWALPCFLPQQVTRTEPSPRETHLPFLFVWCVLFVFLSLALLPSFKSNRC